MRFPKASGSKPERVYILVKNDNATALTRGVPVCYVIDGTNDGVAVDLPSVGAAAKATSLFAGVMVETPAQNKVGYCQVFGYNEYTKVTRMTRAASTDSYASVVAIALGDILNVDTVGDGLTRSAAGAASAALPYCVACETVASSASSASTTSDSSTAKTTSLKTFIRAL